MVRAAIGVPLVKGGRLAAVFFLHFPVAHQWPAHEVALVEETAERTWAAVERARAEAALRESEERFRHFADASTDVLWIRNAETLVMEYLNPAFELIYGQPRQEDRKSTRLNSSHANISYAVFCLKKQTHTK